MNCGKGEGEGSGRREREAGCGGEDNWGPKGNHAEEENKRHAPLRNDQGIPCTIWWICTLWCSQFWRHCFMHSHLTTTMTTLLTLDDTMLFFHTLCLSSKHHVASVKNWWSSVDTTFNPSPSASTAPSLTRLSTHSLISKCQSAANDSIINLCGPTLKKLRTQGPKTTIINSIVKVVVDGEDDICGGSFSDQEEMDCPEAFAACLSPLKYGAWVTSSVITYSLYLPW